MTYATVQQVRAVAEYARYVAEYMRPLSLDEWCRLTYHCAFEDLGHP